MRDSERKVKEVIYRTIAKLKGKGLSQHEAVLAVIIVGTHHTTLGFSNAMDSLVGKVEEDMKISQITSKFMVSLDISSKNSSVAGLALDILLKLVSPDTLILYVQSEGRVFRRSFF